MFVERNSEKNREKDKKENRKIEKEKIWSDSGDRLTLDKKRGMKQGTLIPYPEKSDILYV